MFYFNPFDLSWMFSPDDERKLPSLLSFFSDVVSLLSTPENKMKNACFSKMCRTFHDNVFKRSSFLPQEIPMNFIDPKELDVPNCGTKNRYRTILPSEYLVLSLPVEAGSGFILLGGDVSRTVDLSDGKYSTSGHSVSSRSDPSLT